MAPLLDEVVSINIVHSTPAGRLFYTSPFSWA